MVREPTMTKEKFYGKNDSANTGRAGDGEGGGRGAGDGADQHKQGGGVEAVVLYCCLLPERDWWPGTAA